MTYEIRPIIRRDVIEVLRIENDCFKHPWDLDTFVYLADNHGQILDRNGETHMLVVGFDNNIVGYIVWRFYQNSRMGHLLNIAVDNEHRRKGIARSLVTRMFSVLLESNASSCFLEVRESNKGAQAFYEEMGMVPIKRRRNYYVDEDAIIYHINFQVNV